MPVAQCSCGARYKVREGLEGRKARCKKCGAVFQIPGRDEAPIPVAGEPDLPGAAAAGAGPPPADTASASMFDESGVSTALDPDAAPRTDHLPRLRPRTGFWSDVGWTLAFFISPHNMILFLVVWVLLLVQELVLFIPLVGLLVAIIIGMYVLAWYVSIIPEAAAGEDDLPKFSASGGFYDDVFIPCLQYVGTYAALLLPACLYFIFVARTTTGATMLLASCLDVFTLINATGAADAPLIALVALAIFFWPIAIMCVSMGGLSALSRIDLIVVAVVRTFPAYVVIFIMVSLADFLPGFILDTAAGAAPSAGGIATGGLAFTVLTQGVGLYFSIVSMRLIGLHYRHFKQRFPWDWE